MHQQRAHRRLVREHDEDGVRVRARVQVARRATASGTVRMRSRRCSACLRAPSRGRPVTRLGARARSIRNTLRGSLPPLRHVPGGCGSGA